MNIKVFNADDHPILRKGLSDLLKETEGLDWVGSAADGKEAMEKIRSLQPDVAILDIEMPHFSGIQVLETLLSEGIKTNFVLLTLFKDESFFQNAIKAGAKGYLLKESSEQEIINCIRSVHRGFPYVNPELTHFLFKSTATEEDLTTKLTTQEINILKLIAREKTTAEIASMLFISPKTVGNHRNNISKKLELAGEQNGLLKWALANKNRLK